VDDAATDTAQIIRAAQRGSAWARDRLLRDLQDVWYRFLLSQLGNAEAAREGAQETALRFLRQLPQFRGESRLQTWSIGIALNVAREMRRVARPVIAELLPGNQREAVGPHEVAQAAEARAALHAVLDELPERQREAVVLRFFEEMSVEQTARIMNCAAGTVKATVHQALRALRKKLSQ